jgi:hypothetical protein
MGVDGSCGNMGVDGSCPSFVIVIFFLGGLLGRMMGIASTSVADALLGEVGPESGGGGVVGMMWTRFLLIIPLGVFNVY